MPKATDVLTRETLNAIAKANEEGVVLAGLVRSFTTGARIPAVSFQHETTAHHLPDDDYEAVVLESGMEKLIRLTMDMESALSTLWAEGT